MIMTDQPPWTSVDVLREYDRRLTEALASLGSRPGWLRFVARREFDRQIRRLRRAHADDLKTMLAAQSDSYRAIVALLIGWQHPGDAKVTVLGARR